MEITNEHALAILLITNSVLSFMIWKRVKEQAKKTRKETQEIKTRLAWVKKRQLWKR